MSRTTDYVTAIDIGTTKIVAIVGKRESNGKLEILGVGSSQSKGVKRGVVLNIDEAAETIKEAVEKAKDKSGIKFENVYVGIAGQHIKSVLTRGYKYIDSKTQVITQEDVDFLTQDMYKIPIEAGEEIIHVIPQSYIVDNETGIKNPVGMAGRRLEANFHIVIGQLTSAKNINTCITRAGMNVVKLILEPLASSAAVLTNDEKEAGVALIDIGGGTTDIAVFYDGIIRHTAVIPFGGNAITKDIKEGCSILNRYAELLKIQYGSCIADMAPDDKVVTMPGIGGREPKEITFKNLAHIIQARMEEIIDVIAFEIENSGYFDKLGAGIALTGGGALLRHLPQLIKFKTGLDVRVGLPNKHNQGSIGKNLNQPMYATSVGLLLKGYEHADTKKIEPIATKIVEQPIVNEEEPENKEGKKSRDGLIGALKRHISEIFEEKDTKM